MERLFARNYKGNWFKLWNLKFDFVFVAELLQNDTKFIDKHTNCFHKVKESLSFLF